MTLAETYHKLIDMGEQADLLCQSLHKRRDLAANHDLHRVAVVLHDFANTVADSLKALPESTRKHIVSNQAPR
jgi:hypothetical protein